MDFARVRHGAKIVVLVAALSLVAAGCGNNEGGGGGGGGGTKIALLLPELTTARYESQDKPLFEAKVKELCSDCQVLYSNANQQADQQQSQAEAALTNGAKVLVLDPVDSAAAAAIVTMANQQNVPVISYDRLILNSKVDYYVAFDSVQVGQLQAQALVDKLQSDGDGNGTIVMINGDPADNNAKLFKQGAHSVIDKSDLKIGKEYDTPDWLPANAQREMDQAITALGKDGFVGVYAANDGTGGGAIAAMIAAGIDPSTRPTTGQDAELAGIQRVLSGQQYVTVYKPLKLLAETAAEVAVDLATGVTVPASMTGGTTVNNGQVDVPSVLLNTVAVTADNIKDTVVADGFWTVDQICTSEFAKDCSAAGLT